MLVELPDAPLALSVTDSPEHTVKEEAVIVGFTTVTVTESVCTHEPLVIVHV